MTTSAGRIARIARHLVLVGSVLAPGCAGPPEGLIHEEQFATSEEPLPGCAEVGTPLEDPTNGNKPSLVLISNTETDLQLLFIGQDWLIDSISLYAGVGPVPTNAEGKADPAQFPVQVYLGGVPHHTVSVPLPAGCGGTIKIAAYVTLFRTGPDGVEYIIVWAGGTPWGPEGTPGWVFGIPLPFCDTGAWFIEYTVCCGTSGCTLTQGYWKTHPEDWPVDSLVIGGVTYSPVQLMVLLWMPVNKDVSVSLAHQLVAALLNLANGATASPEVTAAIAAAQTWMAANRDADGMLPYGVLVKTTAGQQAVSLAATLASFNEGTAGTMHCDALAAATD